MNIDQHPRSLKMKYWGGGPGVDMERGERLKRSKREKAFKRFSMELGWARRWLWFSENPGRTH